MAKRRAATETRDWIIDQASRLVHSQGFDRTTLAQFAEAAEVPLGNFYYYFKTKESLCEALIAKRIDENQALVAQWEKEPSPRDRLLCLVANSLIHREALAEHGCPIGSLTQELAKKGGPLAEKSGAIFEALLVWTARQFAAMGYEKNAQALAIQTLASLQGTTLIANAVSRSDLLVQETERLSRWIKELPLAPGATPAK